VLTEESHTEFSKKTIQNEELAWDRLGESRHMALFSVAPLPAARRWLAGGRRRSE
jgi:hypothetical protein